MGDDYVFKTYPNHPESYFNPTYVTVVRNISFFEIRSSIEVLKSLLLKLKQVCSEVEDSEKDRPEEFSYEVINGNFNISLAFQTCNGKGKKLIEIQDSTQLLVLLQKLKGKLSITPAGTDFDGELGNFIFKSNKAC